MTCFILQVNGFSAAYIFNESPNVKARLILVRQLIFDELIWLKMPGKKEKRIGAFHIQTNFVSRN